MKNNFYNMVKYLYSNGYIQLLSKKNRVKAILVLYTLIITLICSAPVRSSISSASQINVHPLYLDKPQNSDRTYATLRDNNGFLWIATDNGLKRYDGYQYKVFSANENNPHSIRSNNITTLLLDKSGSLWAAGNTLNLYHPETESFSSYAITNNLTIQSLHESNSGIIWIAGEGFGLLGFDIKKREVIHQFFTNNKTRYISSISAKQSSSLLWVSTNSGLYSFDTNTFKITHYELPLNFTAIKNVIRHTTEDRNGNLWLATYQGLIVLNPKTKKIKTYAASHINLNGIKSNTLNYVFEDSKGQIWIGTDKKGVHRYQPETDTFLHFPDSLSNNLRFPPTSINHIVEDNEGTLWFSVDVSGIYRISEHLEKFRTLQNNSNNDDNLNNLAYNNVLDLLEDKSKNVWIATDGGGLDKLNPQTQELTHYRHDPKNPLSISGDDVLSLAEDSKGYIWVGTWGSGLNRLNPKTGEFKRIQYNPNSQANKTLSNNNIFRIEIDANDQLYLSLWSKGLQIYNPATDTYKSFIPFDEKNPSSIRNLSINDFQVTTDGKYWLGGHSGLELFDPQTNTFTQIAIHGVDVVNDIHLDKNGTLWLATANNLIRFHPSTNTTKYYSTQNGLADNFVVSIEEDDRGNLWLGTRRGLSRFSPSTEDFSSFTEKDGLAGSQFNNYSHLKTKDGYMYFGGDKGLSIFHPDNLPMNNHVPKVHLTNFEIFQQSVIPGNTPWLKKQINLTKQLELPYDKKDILFEFSALNFISPTQNSYKYKLKGLEDNWITATSSQRRVRYTNLAPGEYTFQVLGSNNEELWNGTAKEIQLTILPAWWQTWWAITIYTLIFLTAVYGFSFWRLRLIRLHQIELETIVKQQTLELKKANKTVIQLNSELEQRVSHRLEALSSEVEERRDTEERSIHLAFHDPLTNLPNRAWLLRHLDKLIKERLKSEFKFALFFISGEKFKQINDTHGHLMGDMLLIAAGQRLKQILPHNFHVIRLGSDEFTVVIDKVSSESQVTEIAENILLNFKEVFVIEQASMNFNISIGMLICSNEYKKPTQILRNVDIAMSHAKSKGRGAYQLFDNNILKQTLDSTALQSDLIQALKNKEFEVVYQPIIVIATGELSGFETLLRWKHLKHGLVSPEKFIPIVEELEIIFDIGLWVLEQACLQLVNWKKLVGTKNVPTIAVNLSPLQLKQTDLLQKFDAIVCNIGTLKEKLKLEITESALMEHTGASNQRLKEFRQRGIELAIDDFGTGYSSLSYLDKLPVQALKIDRSFISSLFDKTSDNNGAHEIVRATIDLAHKLNMRVVAEGIETEEQLNVLKRYHCDFGQGYWISSPLTPEAATEFLLKNSVNNIE